MMPWLTGTRTDQPASTVDCRLSTCSSPAYPVCLLQIKNKIKQEHAPHVEPKRLITTSQYRRATTTANVLQSSNALGARAHAAQTTHKHSSHLSSHPRAPLSRSKTARSLALAVWHGQSTFPSPARITAALSRMAYTQGFVRPHPCAQPPPQLRSVADMRSR